MTARPALSVVVPTRNRPRLLEGCLAALAAVLGPDDEVVVVDSASDDPVATAAVARRHGARCVGLAVAGTSRARNAGWRAAHHALMAFVDDDMRVAPGWADALVAGLALQPFVTGGVAVPPGQEGAERPVAVTTRTRPERLDGDSAGVLGCSGNLGVRRDALALVGGFDERLGPGTWFASAEDVDLFDRLFAAGCDGLFVPEAHAHHEQWRSRRQLLRLDWAYGKGAGARLARLLRTDPRRWRRLAAEQLWREGLRMLVSDLRRGYEFGAALLAARLAGTLVGALVAVVGLRRPWTAGA